MNPATTFLRTAVISAMLGVPNAALANLLTNPSFETGDFTGWTVTNPNGLSDSVRCSGASFFGGASNGSCAVQLNGGDTTPDAVLEQTFTTESGITYSVSFDIGKYTQPLEESISSVLVEVLDGESPLAGFPLSAVDSSSAGDGDTPMAPEDFETFFAIFEAVGTSTTLRITDQTTNEGLGFDTMLDNFSVVAVPEPARSVLILLMFAVSRFTVKGSSAMGSPPGDDAVTPHDDF